MRALAKELIGALVAGGCSGGRPAAERARLAGAPLAVRLAAADPGNGRRLFAACAACHSVGEGAGDRDGPNLHGVVGAPVGGNSPRYSYTSALQAVGGVWTPDALDRWLTDPRAMVTGTRMSFSGLANGADRADIIAYLETESGRRPAPPLPRR